MEITFIPGGVDIADIDEAVEIATATEGIPSSVLTAIPLSEVKQTARRILAGASEVEPWPVPKRCRTEEDYALLVAELIRIRQTGSAAPQQVLAERLGISKGTMSERVKRARELALIPPDSLTLTNKAQRLLSEFKDSD
ncbi:hypothetical protein ACIA8F_04595 [Streptomyces sp. NPDC051563]|uniref:hypothetical protein n=1 Tax=Streptomyces sp. NPDC051563 TaxID=3365659 RepID=UPI0037B7391A